MTLRKIEARRKGAVLFVVLAAAAIAAMALTASIRAAFMRQLHQRTQHWRRQADWLAVSGLERARAKLAVDRKYAGETWNAIPVPDDGASRGVVRIAISGDDKARWIVVEARFPDSENGAKASRELQIGTQ